jgi:hypothetical protein
VLAIVHLIVAGAFALLGPAAARADDFYKGKDIRAPNILP